MKEEYKESESHIIPQELISEEEGEAETEVLEVEIESADLDKYGILVIVLCYRYGLCPKRD